MNTFDTDFEDGLRFQDAVIKTAHDTHGWLISTYSSAYFQKLHGEGVSGIEIKYDRQVETTGNLFFETAFKNAEGRWQDSGIYSDGHWLFVIGNYEEAFVFFTRQLRYWDKKQAFRSVERTNSVGMLMPVDKARLFAAGLTMHLGGKPR